MSDGGSILDARKDKGESNQQDIQAENHGMERVTIGKTDSDERQCTCQGISKRRSICDSRKCISGYRQKHNQAAEGKRPSSDGCIVMV